MIALGVSTNIQGVTTTATQVTYTITGLLMTNASPPVASGYQVLAQGQMAASAGALLTTGSTQTVLVSSIYLNNTASTVQSITLYIGGTAAANAIVTLIIPGNGFAVYEDQTGWLVYSQNGYVINAGTGGTPGGVGTPAATTTSFTASTAVVAGGTSVALTTGQLFVGSRYRFHIDMIKTAAGVATWTAAVKFGTANTNADAAIATWTSGTNTAAIDQCLLIIEMVVLTLGASATAACTAFYVNTLTNATGFGSIAAVPSPTAAFNSTSTSPFLHVDITQGASAVVTGVGMAERLV
jgi:hypothetical protein